MGSKMLRHGVSALPLAVTLAARGVPVHATPDPDAPAETTVIIRGFALVPEITITSAEPHLIGPTLAALLKALPGLSVKS